MKFNNYEKKLGDRTLYIPEWSVGDGENWAVLGSNGSGKTQLGGILNSFETSKNIAYISFERVEALLEEEREKDDTDFMDRIDDGTLVEEFIPLKNDIFDLEYLRGRGIKYLSTGELVKLTLIKEWNKRPDYLILDEPYDGLDLDAQKVMSDFIDHVCRTDITLILIINRESDIHQSITHLALIHNFSLLLTGDKKDILQSDDWKNLQHFSGDLPSELPGMGSSSLAMENLVEMNGVDISYDGKPVLNNISWSINSGDHFRVIGPNGSGKSTLLKIINADNHKSYGQDITLFGMKRGTGESIWDIKKHVGLVSSSLQSDYRVSVNALTVILSGFYDSIGLYNRPTSEEVTLANEWLVITGLESYAEETFKTLSYGIQRMLLIIRAMVKHPKILILDEPCLGLDPVNRELILLLLDYIAKTGKTTLLYVSHREEDVVPSIKKELRLKPDRDGSSGEVFENQ